MSFGAVASIGGALIGASAAGDAADSQANSAAAATAAQRAMFDKQVELQAPFRDAGLTANNRLMYLLGLGGSVDGKTRTLGVNDLINESGGDWAPNADLYGSNAGYKSAYDKFIKDHQNAYGVAPNVGRGSNLGAVESEIAAGRYGDFNLDAFNKNALAGQPDPSLDKDYGSLMRDFSMADFEADPGYQFRMDEGTRAVEGGAAARGGLLSGAAQKALQKYGQGMASQEYGNAFNRFTGQQTNKYNRLAGIVNTGQGATNQVSNAAGQFGQQQASNIIGAGNAAAAGQIGSANALVGGINQGFNSYQNNQLMNMIRNPGAGSTSWGNVNNQYFTGTGGMGD